MRKKGIIYLALKIKYVVSIAIPRRNHNPQGPCHHLTNHLALPCIAARRIGRHRAGSHGGRC